MIPNMSKLSKNWLFPEIFPSSQKFRENSRWDWILKFRVLNQVPWWKLSWKNTQYMEISQNQPILEHFGISGFRESQNPNCAKGHQKSAKILQICYSNHLCKNISKKHLFGKVAFLLCKSSSSKKTIWTFGFFLTKKFFWVKHESL